MLDDLSDLSETVSNIESKYQGIPILLKHYLKVGGQLLGFNIDPEFANVLDGLILVDVTKTESKILRKYMGQKGADEFLAYHEPLNQATA